MILVILVPKIASIASKKGSVKADTAWFNIMAITEDVYKKIEAYLTTQ